MSVLCSAFALALSVSALTLAAAAAAGPHVSGVAGGARQVIVQAAPGVTAGEVAELAASHQATLVGAFRKPGAGRGTLYCLRPKTGSAGSLAASLAGEDGLVRAVPDTPITADARYPNDTDYRALWGLYAIDLPLAWDLTTGAGDVVVAVIDTGVDMTAPDLAANIWVNPGEVAGNGVDDDGDGYVDDVNGIDAFNHDTDPRDDANHGTGVAGVAGAVGNNRLGLTGVAWDVRIMPLKALGANRVGTNSAALECIQYAIRMKTQYGVNVVAINASWGGSSYPEDPLMKQAIAAAGQAGIVWCASAGNDGKDNDAAPRFPSSYDLPTIVTAASSNNQDQVSAWSNYGATSVDLAAPGDNIRVVATTAPTATTTGSYAWSSGTSYSAPDVAGVIALEAALYPDETALQRVDRVLSGVEQIPAAQGRVKTGGRLNAYGALTAELRPVTQAAGVDAGWHTAPADVTFSASDGTGIGVDHSEYSLDGGPFQTGSAVSVADGIHGLAYRSVDLAGNVEIAKTATVRVDTASPVITATGGEEWSRGPVDVALAVSDATSGVSSWRYAVDGGDWTAGSGSSGTVQVSGNGTHTLTVQATDVAGNVSAVAGHTVLIDTEAPRVSASGADDAWHNRPFTVRLQAADASSGVAAIEYRASGAEGWTRSGGDVADVVVPADGPEGVRAYEYRAIDVAGNTSDVSTFGVRIDTTAPAAEATGADDAWHADPVTVHISAGDAASGVTEIRYRLKDASSWTVVPGDAADVIVPAAGDDGARVYEYRASDAAGNVSGAAAFTVKIDATGPSVDVSGADAAWHNAPVTVALTAADSSSGAAWVEYRAAGAETWTRTAGSSATVVVVPAAGNDGPHTYEYRSADLAGNVSAVSSFTVRTDVTAPAVSAVGASAAWRSTPMTVNLAAVDQYAGVSYLEYRLSGAASWTRSSGSAAVTVPAAGNDGVHTYEYRAADTAGNLCAVSAFTVRIDTTAPVSTLTGADTAWHNAPVLLSLSATDALSGVARTEFSLNGAAWTPAATLLVVAQGVNTVSYRSTDMAGVVETARSVQVRIDSVRPTTAGSASTGQRSRTATLNYKVADATPSCGQATVTGIVIRNSAGAVAKSIGSLGTVTVNKSLTYSFSCTLAAGTYKFTVSARDIAGNAATSLTAGTLTVRK